MRRAVEAAYKELTGYDAEACFSGWGDKFTLREQGVIADNDGLTDEMVLDLTQTTDVAVWANAFERAFPESGIDQGTMIGWFANAMMAKADEIDRKPNPVRAFLDKHEISCAESIYQRDVMAQHALELIEELADEVGYWVDPEGED